MDKGNSKGGLKIEQQSDLYSSEATPCVDVYKAKIQSVGSIDQIKLSIVVRGDLQNKKLVVEVWSPTASVRTLKYLLADAAKHKAIIYQLDFIGSFL